MYEDIFESIRNEAENATLEKEPFSCIVLMSVTFSVLRGSLSQTLLLKMPRRSLP